MKFIMAATVTSYPPLGKVTCLKGDKIKFTALLQSEPADWEVQVWHNIEGPEWAAFLLQKCLSTSVPSMSKGQTSKTRHAFEGEIPRPQSGSGRFTIRYKKSGTDEWRWANKEQDIGDGELIFPLNTLTSDLAASSQDDFGKYFDNLSSEITVGLRKSEAPGAALWHLSGSVESAGSGQSGTASLPLGAPSAVSRFFALVRVGASWLGPRQGKEKLDLSEDALLCSFLRQDGTHVVLLAVSIDDTLTLLRSGPNGEVFIKSKNDNPTPSAFQVLAAAAPDFEIALSALTYEARKLVRPYDLPVPFSSNEDPKAQWVSSWYDGLTYCTWNSLGPDLSEEKILSALNDLKSSGINISGLIIDDGWQSLDNEGSDSIHRGWTDFEADPTAFPNGLASTVSKINERHPNITHIAVWHALFGYWGGISPNGPLAKKYKTREVAITNSSRKSILTIDPSDIQHFYTDFYTFLSNTGITGVKTDVQSTLDTLSNPHDRKSYIQPYQTAWTISSLRSFGSNVTSCMSQFPQSIFSSQIPTNKPSIVARNSDDFFPDVEDAGHTWHVYCNAHNALLGRFLNVTPDWDMFQTSPSPSPSPSPSHSHSYASFHAAARCISGGPISITDTPGQHDPKVINQICAPTVQGDTVILRPGIPGRTLDMYTPINETSILKIGTYHGRARTGSGVLGCFNVSNSKRMGIVRVSEFPGVYEDDKHSEYRYIVRAHCTGKIAEGLKTDSTISITLEEKGWEILTVYPSFPFTARRVSTTVSVLGLLGKMSGVAAVVNSDMYIESNGGLRVDVALKALGVLGVYFSELPQWDIDEHFMVLISGLAVPRKTVWKEDGVVLAVDVGEAWRAMGLETGWSNEVRVSILL